MSSGWIGLSLGRSSGGAVAPLVYLVVIASAVVFRIYQVLRYPRALEAFVSGKVVATLRFLSIGLMVIGGLAGLAIFFIRPLALLIFGQPGDSGVAFYITGMFLVFIAPLGWKACLAFEISRWIGRARSNAPRVDSPFRWKQDGIVALAIPALFAGGLILQSRSVKTDLAHACKTDRIACIAKVDERLPRMVALPMGSRVRLVSNIESIRMQMRDGDKVKWEVVEGVSNSLKVSGYEPSDDETLPVTVFVHTGEAGEGLRLEVRVTEQGEEVSRMTADFPSARLEENADGGIDLLAPLPPRSESKGGVRVDEPWKDYQALDQLYVFFRRAIGTEIEANESRIRITDAHQSIGRASVSEKPIPKKYEQDKSICDGKLQMTETKEVLSSAGTTRGWPLMELRLSEDGSRPPFTYVHRSDRIACTARGIWIVHYVPVEPSFTVKRFSSDGKIERFIEGTLPVVATERAHGRIDPRSLREDHGALWFERIEARVDFDREVTETVLARETFKVPLPTE